MKTLIEDLKKVMSSDIENKDKYIEMLINGFLREKQTEQLPIQGVVQQSEQFNCYEMHAYSRFAGCTQQCKECADNEKSEAI